jgi:succinate dehydrogenase/fumarate reductase cytochrome b subunit
VRRHAAVLSLLTFQVLVAVLSAIFHVRARPAVLDAFRAYDTEIPPLTEVALAPWFLPAAVGLAILLAGVALVAPLRRSLRPALLGVGLVVSSFALMFAVWAAFAPIFRPGVP